MCILPIVDLFLPFYCRPADRDSQGDPGQRDLRQHGGDLLCAAGGLHPERPLPVSNAAHSISPPINLTVQVYFFRSCKSNHTTFYTIFPHKSARILYRNSPVLCDVFPQLNLQLWKTDAPALQVPEAILIQTLEKGTQGLARRRKEEYKLWETSEYCSATIILGGVIHDRSLQTWAPIPSRPRGPPSPSPSPTRRRSASPTRPYSWSTPPGSS